MKPDENIYLLSLKIKEVLEKNPDYKDIVLISTLLAKAIYANNLNSTDIFKTGKEYSNIEDAILDKISELDLDISKEEQDIIDKYNLKEFDKDSFKLEERKEEKPKKEEKKKSIKIQDEIKIDEEVKEEKSKIQLVKRYTVNSLIQLNKCKVYVSANDEKEFAILTGRFYIYNKNIVNNRIKISKRIKDKIIGWVDLKDITIVKR